MLKLIKKEISLCLHPAALVFTLFGAFVLIPDYPYGVMFFFSGLGAFFICLTGRENGDYPFTCSLPVKKSRVAQARILLCVGLQTLQLTVAAICTVLKVSLFPMPNNAGMDAGVSFFGLGFLMLGVLNATFFPLHFSKPDRVGIPFLVSSIALFFIVLADIVLSVALPAYGIIDDVFMGNLPAQLVCMAAGFLCYLAGTAGALLFSGRNFARVDL